MLENKALIVRLKCGNAQALEEIYHSYKDELLTMTSLLLAGGAEAEEVLREVFVSFAKAAAGFGLGTNLRGHLIHYLVNTVRDKLRDNIYEVTELELGKRPGLTIEQAGQSPDSREQAELLCAALATVTLQQREAVVLHLQGRMSFQEIASLQDTTINTVQGRYRYGLEKLTETAGGIGGAEESIKNLRLITKEQADESIIKDASAALAESTQAQPAGGWLSICEWILKSRLAQAAAAAVVIVAILSAGVLFSVLREQTDQVTDRLVQNETPVAKSAKTTDPNIDLMLETELEKIGRLFAAGDVAALAKIAAAGPFESQFALLNYLEKQGDSIPGELLDRLLAEGRKLGIDNSFAEIIEKVKARAMAAKKGTFELVVLDKKTSEAVEEASIDFVIGDTSQKGTTDSQGLCRIDLGQQRPDYVRMLVRKEGFVPILISYPYEDTRGGYMLLLERGNSIGGIVESSDGKPIEGATVYLRIKAGEGIEKTAILDYPVKTDSQGKWKCQIAPENFEYIGVKLSHAEFLDDEQYRTMTEDAQALQDMTAVLVMEKAAGVQDSESELTVGRIYLPDGTPAAQADIIICRESETVEVYNGEIMQKQLFQNFRTDADGRFSFSAPRWNYVLVIVHGQGYAEATRSRFHSNPEITLKRWGRVEGELRIGSQAGWGEIVTLFYQSDDETDKPQVNYSCESITGVNGEFVFEWAVSGRAIIARKIDLGEGRIVLSNSITGDTQNGETAAVSIGGTGTAVTGKIVFPSDYQGDADFSNSYGTLTVRSAVDQETPWQRLKQWGFVIEDDGSFWIDDVPPGRYEMMVRLFEPGSNQDTGRYMGDIDFDFDVPPPPAEAISDEPLDLGVILIYMEN